jgi:hypothetical protein
MTQVVTATDSSYPTGWAVVNKPPGKDLLMSDSLSSAVIDQHRTDPKIAPVRQTDAFSGIAYGDNIVRSALMLPHLAPI